MSLAENVLDVKDHIRNIKYSRIQLQYRNLWQSNAKSQHFWGRRHVWVGARLIGSFDGVCLGYGSRLHLELIHISYVWFLKIRIEEMNDAKPYKWCQGRQKVCHRESVALVPNKCGHKCCHCVMVFIFVPCQWARTRPSFTLSKRHIADMSKTGCWPTNIDGDRESATNILC